MIGRGGAQWCPAKNPAKANNNHSLARPSMNAAKTPVSPSCEVLAPVPK